MITDKDASLDSAYLEQHESPLLQGLQEETRAPANENDAKRDRLERLLSEHSGNISAVARVLGKPRAQIYRWLRRYGRSAGAATRTKPT